MKFIEHFIQKPVIAAVICVASILAGILAYHTLPLRQYPVFPSETITIQTEYAGAAPDVMQGFITIPIEQALSDMEGVDTISGSNLQGMSRITIKLKSGYNMTTALTDVNTRVSSVLWRLPSGINNPVITKSTTASPSLYLSVTTSEGMTQEEATAYVNRVIVPELQSISGVADMRVRGSRDYAMRIWLNPKKMAAKNVTTLDVMHALSRSHLQAAAGKVKSAMQEFNVTINSSLSTPESFNNIVVFSDRNQTVKLKDVGYAKLGAQNADISVISNGKPGLLIFVNTQPDVDSIATVKVILKRLPLIQKRLPSGLHIGVLWDTTQFSEKSIKSVQETIQEAVILIVLVTCLFLGDLKAMLVPVATIPLSLLGACGILYLIGYSINTMTLLAAVLAIGLVVDDAIVVLENVHRHINEGMAPLKAAMVGTKEIFWPVIAMTVIVAVVFVPVGMATGITGSLFREFSFTLSITVMLSGFYAITVSPVMCGYLLSPGHNAFAQKVDVLFTAIENAYFVFLKVLFKIRYLIVVGFLLLVVACYSLVQGASAELLPELNQGVILGVGAAPTSANHRYVYHYAEKLSDIFKQLPEMKQYGVIVGDSPPYNNLVGFLMLKDPKKGVSYRNEQQLIQYLGPKLAAIPGMELYPMNRPPLADVVGLSSPVSFVIQTTGSYEELYQTVNAFIDKAKANTNLLNLHSDLFINKPDIHIDMNREKASVMGVSMQDVAATLNALLGEPKIAWFSLGGFSYPVIPQAMRSEQLSPKKLEQIYVRTASNKLVPLSTLVRFKEAVSPLSLNDFQQMRSATVSANLATGYTLGQALGYLENLANHFLPGHMKYDYSAESRLFVESSGKMVYIFIAAILAIYLLLAVKFNSFMDPLIIMGSVPLSAVGGLLAIHLNNFTLNIYTEIGLVMLIGLISKHGIMIVDFANHLRDQGESKWEAAGEGARVRLRPILMTTIAMVLGVIPLTMASGAGHESLQQIGWVVAGGLTIGSALTLMIVPTFYGLFSRRVSGHVEGA